MRDLNGFKTGAAYCASIIKKELKAKFPGIKFSIRSEVFAGGDSINIRFTGTKENAQHLAEIKTICSKYKAGYFNGMEDIYEYTNKTEGPTVKYLFVEMDTAE